MARDREQTSSNLRSAADTGACISGIVCLLCSSLWVYEFIIGVSKKSESSNSSSSFRHSKDGQSTFYFDHNSNSKTDAHPANRSETALRVVLAIVALFGVFLLVMFCALGFNLLCARGSRSYEPVNSNNNSDEELSEISLVAVNVMIGSDDDAPVAIAKEEIPDQQEDFTFFVASDEDPVAQRLKEIVDTGEWKAIRDVLKRKVGSNSQEERAFYFDIVKEEVQKTWPKEPMDDLESACPWLDDWAKKEPNNCDCRIMRASIGTLWAWHARSGNVPRRLEKQQRKHFGKRLKKASAELQVAIKLRPQDPLVYTTAVPIAMALKNKGMEIMEIETCLDRIKNVANDPLFFQFHIHALQYYCKKWHGSHQEMFSYVKSVTSNLPAGHPLWSLVPMAHFERTLIRRSRGYWKQADVIREIGAAYKQAFPDGPAETSAQATVGYRKHQEWICRNYFAYALTKCGQAGPARRQIRIIGRRPTERPWGSMQEFKRSLKALGFDLQNPTASADITSIVVTEIV